MSGVEHELVEIMAGRWDEQGHRPPTDWRFVCACGVRVDGFKDQTAVGEAWRAHRSEPTGEAS